MSGANAISGITLVGALTSAGAGHAEMATILGTLGVTFASINVVGGLHGGPNRMLSHVQEEGRWRPMSNALLINLTYVASAVLFHIRPEDAEFRRPPRATATWCPHAACCSP